MFLSSILNHEAKPSGFRPDKTRSASLLNGFKNTSVSLWTERFKLREENNSIQEKQATPY